MWHQLQHRWFLLALIVVLAGGMGWPELLTPLADAMPRSSLVAAVMFLMALPLETAVVWQAIRRPGPAWLAALVNSGLAPPLGWLVAWWLPSELATGVIVAMTVPCTLAAATVWTRRAGGNDAVSILVTMITNLACFLVVPGWLWLLVGAKVSFDYAGLVWQLVLLVVLPIVVAQGLRQHRQLGNWATWHKSGLSTLAQIGILSMVLVGAVGCGQRIHDAANGHVLSLQNVTIMLIAVAAAHLTLFAVGLSAARGLAMTRPDAIAVGIAGSQKTQMVGLYLALQFGPLAILPMVAYHATQLLLDTLLADWLREPGLAAPAGE
jgi:sodium/bile acid cotransporter 7